MRVNDLRIRLGALDIVDFALCRRMLFLAESGFVRFVRFAMPVIFCLLIAPGVQADTFVYPSESKPLFAVEIPTLWLAEVDEEGSLYAESPDGDAWLYGWVGSRELPLDKLANEIDENLADDFKDIEFEDPEDSSINGISVINFFGQGVEIDGGESAQLHVAIFEEIAEAPFILYAVTYEDTRQSTVSQINGIISSVQDATIQEHDALEDTDEIQEVKQDGPPVAEARKHVELKDGEWRPQLELDNQIFPSLVMSLATIKDDNSESDPYVIGDEYGFVGAILAGAKPGSKVRLVIKPNLFMNETIFDAVLAKGGTYEIYPTVNYKFDELLMVRQVKPVNIVMEIYLNGESLGQKTVVATVRSLNDCPLFLVGENEEDGVDLTWLFTAYVNENHPWVNQLTKEALQTGVVEAFTGYQSGDPDEVVQQVFALWNVLQRRGMKYSDISTPSAESEVVISQHVRLFDETVNAQQANCVDGTVLFAAVLRKIGINPYLVLMPDHMFLAFDLDQEGENMMGLETTLMGATDLKRHEKKNISTELQERNKNKESWKSFKAAIDEGSELLSTNSSRFDNDEDVDYQLISVANARKIGVLPLASRAVDGKVDK